MKNNLLKHFDDETLLALLQDHDDVNAFEEIYLRYLPMLYNKANEKLRNHFMAQEAIQDLFISFWQNYPKIQLQTNLRNYLFGIVKNQIINQFRKQLLQEKLLLQEIDSTNCTEETLAYETLNNDYQHALSKLPEKCREVFLLSRMGHTNKEIASKLQIAEKTVEQHITKALRLLRLHLKDYALLAVLGFYTIS